MSTHTGAGLQTARESAGFTRDQLAKLCRVEPRTIKHWESGRAGVPDDVMHQAESMAAMVQAHAQALARALQAAKGGAGHGPAVARYPTDQDLRHFQPGLCAGLATCHAAAVRLALAMAGTQARIFWLDAGDYAQWLDDTDTKDTQAARLSYQNKTAQAQAMPRRSATVRA